MLRAGSFSQGCPARSENKQKEILMNIDLRQYPESIETINSIISKNSIAEIKTEHGGEKIVVVEIDRTLKHSERAGVKEE
ncbi:MAG: hypothetical protein MJ126_09085 [Lachnospiraceae bacterium]|nr:hypothetical protein [Lachnospiraceae bacterium]